MMQIVAQQIDPSGVQELIDPTNVTPWDVLWAILTLLGGIVVARLVRTALRRSLPRVTGLPENIIGLVAKIAGWAVVGLAIVLALPFVGVDTAPLAIVILLIAALVVLSGRVLLENYGAGVILQGEATFVPGDQIDTRDCIGRVVEVSSRAVKIESIDGRSMIIPNTSVLSEPVTNLTARAERRSELVVGLRYGTNLDAAREVLIAATREAPGVLDEPDVDVFVSLFDDSAVTFLVWFWHASDLRSAYATTDAVARSIDRALRRNEMTIAFPQRTLWWGDGTAPPES